MKTIKEVMIDRPHSCSGNETLKAVAIRMFEINIGSLPVVDDRKKVVGIITDRDISLALWKIDKALTEVTVSDIMISPVYTIAPDNMMSDALRIMRIHRIGRLPVVDEEGRLIGMVSLHRILLNTIGKEQEAELEYRGEENILNTLMYLAERNSYKLVDN